MAPVFVRSRVNIAKERVSAHLGALKTQVYNDPSAARGGLGAIRSVAWNSLGTLIATGAGDKTLRVLAIS
jgi:THO complex subunit 3